MNLSELTAVLADREGGDGEEIDIEGIEFDSRRVGGGELFVCLEGLASDGHDFAAAAVSDGARALVVRRRIPGIPEVPQVVVPDTREALALLAARFYGDPSRGLATVGVGGTNGKTTVTQLLAAIGETTGKRCAVFGTLGNRIGGAVQPSGFTTPEAPQVQRLLREAVAAGTDWAVMEVSSHALDQKRVFGIDFAVVVFTNLSHDHLDYHGDMASYGEVKSRLYFPETRGSKREAVAVLNIEDPLGRELAERVSGPVRTYGFTGAAAYRALDLHTTPAGTRYRLETPEGVAAVDLPLLGRFNVLNALAAQAAAMALGATLDEAAAGLASTVRVPGRMDVVPGSREFLVVVDFAHTPDALTHALEAAREFTTGRVLLVFGCGGDRDRAKRPVMGAIAARLADAAWVTSDNPRTEDPERILDEILAGAKGGDLERESDRGRAIERALRSARPGDTVLIAGKGHETVQVLGDAKRPFDDRAVAMGILERLD